MDESFQRLLFRELVEFVEPLGELAESPESLFDFLHRIGWDLEPFLGSNAPKLVDAVAAIAKSVDVLTKFASDPPASLSDFKTALEAARKFFAAIDALSSAVNAVTVPKITEFPGDLLNALALIYLDRKSKRLYRLLEFLTLIQVQPRTVEVIGDAAVRIEGEIPRLRLDRLGLLLTRPGDAFAAEYWPEGIPDRAHAIAVAERLFPRFQDLLVPQDVGAPGIRRLVTFHGRGGGPDELAPEEEERLAAMFTLIWQVLDKNAPVFSEIGLSVGLLPESEGGPGVFAVPFGVVEFEERAGDWLVRLAGNADVGGFKLTRQGFAPLTGERAAARLELGLLPVPEEGSPRLLFGSTNGTRFEIGDYLLVAGLSAEARGVEVRIMISIVDGALVVAADGADSFLRQLLPADGARVTFDLTVGWSNLNGFHVQGSGRLEIRVPTHVQVGPLEVLGVTLSCTPSADGIRLGFGGDLRARLGPLTATVENVGLGVGITFPRSGGNAGLLNLAPGFKLPDGIGLSIDGQGFKGGGFLKFDPDARRYAGVLELEFKGQFSLKAVGLIETRLPGGQPGFSLLIVISAEFTPVQLGFGFTLVGVGGLLGLNRTVKIDVLRAGIATGALASVLFPQDVLENADRIISDLQQIFPAEDGRFVFGPMAKLGWGTPMLLSIELGLIVELPSPVRIALPGVLRALVPAEEGTVVRLQVNFLGAWEEDRRLISFDALLFDSRLVLMPLSGAMAFRLAYGDNPNFLVSVGGFNPGYAPPALALPALERITLHLVDERNLQLTVAAYFAVTSNTVQFGARLELLARASKFNIYGFLGFDALFQLSPFAFAAQVGGGVAVRVGTRVLFSVGLKVQLSGPTPWNVKGSASFRILFVKIKVPVNATWGGRRDTTLPDVEVLPKLKAALADPRNWQAQLPARSNLLVAVREIEAGDHIVAHPAGMLTVSQKVVPLDTPIARFGSQKPADARRFSIVGVRSGMTEFRREPVEEFFAPAQFLELSDAQKLSRRSFEKMPAGVRVSSQTHDLQFSRPVRRELAYETIIVDTGFRIHRPDQRPGEALATFLPLLRGNAVAKSRLSFVRNALPVLGPGRIGVDQESYAVVGTGDLRPFGGGAGFRSETGAQAHMEDLIRSNPGLRGLVQVVPDYEVARAA